MSEFYDVGQERKGARDLRILLLEVVEALVFIVVSAILFRLFLFAPFSVPGFGMGGTLLPGDQLLANRIIYGPPIPFTNTRLIRFKHVRPGEVVVYRNPSEDNQYSIKRCVAGPGQTIYIKDKQLFVDSLPFAFPETAEKGNDLIIDERFSPRDNLPLFRIPKKGDTLHLDSLPLFEFDFAKNLIQQENSGVRITQTADLLINDKYANDLTFDDFRSEKRKPDGTLNFEAMNWLELKNVINFLEAKDDSLRCSFRRTLYMDGRETKQYRVRSRPVFLIGDNWDESMDSRYTGYVAEDRIVARASLIFWSMDRGSLRFRRLFLFI